MPKETVYPAIPVTRVLHETNGTVSVTTKLYGEITPARLAKEQAEIKYRVEQLTPLPPRVERERPIEPERYDEDGFVVRGIMSGAGAQRR